MLLHDIVCKATKTINATRKRVKLHKEIQLSYEDTRNLIRDDKVSGGRIVSRASSVQKTITGRTASARCAKHPTTELYDRLGLQHCLPEEMRARFRAASVYDLKSRKRRMLVRVGTPLLEVGYLVSNSNTPP